MLSLDFSNTHFSVRRPLSSYGKVRTLVSLLIRNRHRFMNFKTKGLYLDVGCGANRNPAKLNLDYDWEPGIDLCCDITRGLPLEDSYVRGIFTEHCIEHVSFEAALSVFREFYRVMMPGAYLRIVVPDLEIYVDHYNQFVATGAMDMPYASLDTIHGIYSPAMSVNRIFRDSGHQFIYDFATLALALQRTGFVEVRRRRFGESGDPGLIFDTPERLIESLYVEAQKPSALRP